MTTSEIIWQGPFLDGAACFTRMDNNLQVTVESFDEEFYLLLAVNWAKLDLDALLDKVKELYCEYILHTRKSATVH